jgi:hypothetical protein
MQPTVIMEETMLDLTWTRTSFLDIGKLATAAAMLVSPSLLHLAPAAKWDLWICGYAMLTICVADLTAEADWQARTSLWLGVWLAVAPWLLGFTDDRSATFMHFSAGAIVSLLSAAELWSADRSPPRRFRPGAARHAELFDVINDDNGDERAGHGALVRNTLIPYRVEHAVERRKRRLRSAGDRRCMNRVDRTARGHRNVSARVRVA